MLMTLICGTQWPLVGEGLRVGRFCDRSARFRCRGAIHPTSIQKFISASPLSSQVTVDYPLQILRSGQKSVLRHGLLTYLDCSHSVPGLTIRSKGLQTRVRLQYWSRISMTDDWSSSGFGFVFPEAYLGMVVSISTYLGYFRWSTCFTASSLNLNQRSAWSMVFKVTISQQLSYKSGTWIYDLHASDCVGSEKVLLPLQLCFAYPHKLKTYAKLRSAHMRQYCHHVEKIEPWWSTLLRELRVYQHDALTRYCIMHHGTRLRAKLYIAGRLIVLWSYRSSRVSPAIKSSPPNHRNN